MQKTCFIVDLERTLLLETLGKLTSLLVADRLDLLLSALNLPPASLLDTAALNLVLLLAAKLSPTARLLALLARV